MSSSRYFFLIMVLFTGLMTAVQAASVDKFTATKVGSHFLTSVSSGIIDPGALKLLYTGTNTGTNLLFIIGYEKGFVVIAGDDRIDPILAYSTEGRPFIMPELHDTVFGSNFWGLIRTYEKVIRHIIQNNISGTSAISGKWSQLKMGGYVPKSPGVVVTPLLTTTWGQGWPYNSMCPANPFGPGGHVLTGCVATAMAQIMKKWGYPSVGLGSFSYPSGYGITSANFNTSYNWAAMPNSTSTVNPEISKINYHAGVSVMSNWGTGNTSVAYSSDEDPVTRALKNYFKWAASAQYVKKSDFTAAEWDTKLQNDLLAGQPIYYRGDGNLSHAWVMDGVDNANLYHFNFGWDGTYNGYYSLGNINPGGNTLTNNQHAIISIKPNDGSTLGTNTTWTTDMFINTNIWVPDSLTLTINPGVTVSFAPGCGLYVFGRLICNGTAANYVTLTASNTAAGWNGIRWDNNYNNRLVMANNAISQLTYTQIQYSQSSGIYCMTYSNVVLDHCKVNDNHANWGAGISVWYLPITVSCCEIYNNHAAIQGAGIFVASTDTVSFLINHNDIHNNLSDGSGGGFYFTSTNGLLFESNMSHHNQAPKGASGNVMSCKTTLNANKHFNNISPSPGYGALYLANDSSTIVNELIANNTANGVYCVNASPSVINSSIVNNNHDAGSGIIFQGNSDAHFKNCIIGGNIANYTTYGNQITIWDADSDPFFDHCNIQDGLAGIGGPGSGASYTTANYTDNISLPSQFVAPSACAGSTCDGLNANWQLQSSSPCVNAGDTSGVSDLLPGLDLAGNPRFDGMIDMGAYEYQASLPALLETGNETIANDQSACFNATHTIIVAGNGTFFKVQAGGSAEMIAGQKISLLPGTTAEEGAYLHGYIAPSGPWCISPGMPSTPAFEFRTDDINNPVTINESGFFLYPNPTTGYFTIELTADPGVNPWWIQCYNFSGALILEKELYSVKKHELTIGEQEPGIYLVRVTWGKNSGIKKILKKSD